MDTEIPITIIQKPYPNLLKQPQQLQQLQQPTNTNATTRTK